MTEPPTTIRKEFLDTESPRRLFVLNLLFALAYFITLLLFFPRGNTVLFWLLIGGEVFHIWQVATFIYTVWDTRYSPPRRTGQNPAVDVFITTAGEPIEIVAETVRAATLMQYAGPITTYILNDGYVAKKSNWRDAEELAQRMTSPERPVRCITRTIPGGAKAGNINHALSHSYAPLIAVFDADHVPHADFLKKTVPYVTNASVGFVQTPQFYKNHRHNYLAQSSWEQQELFYGAICRGKNRLNAVTMCGTNMLISRRALVEVGGMCTESIAEDFVTGLFMHQRGYRSVYVPEVLAEGLATEDLLTYSKQQFRWARGALDVIFRYNPLFLRGLTFAQRIQYLASASFYLSGIVVLIDILLPIIFLYTGLVPIRASGMLLAAVFLPYLLLTLHVIQRVSNNTFTYPSIGLSMSAFHIHIQAFFGALTRQRSAFNISSKVQLSGNLLSLATPHLLYVAVAVIGIVVAYLREGFSSSLINNIAWIALNISVFIPFIRAALPTPVAQRRQPAESSPTVMEGLLGATAYEPTS
jgi:cellulose synthase (UDP-forming)